MEIWLAGLFFMKNYFPFYISFFFFSFLFLSSYSSPFLVIYFSSILFLWSPVQSQLKYWSSGLLLHSDSKDPTYLTVSCLVRLPSRDSACMENIYSIYPSQQPYFGWSLPASKLVEVHPDLGFCSLYDAVFLFHL